jgi:5-methyltetrahydrofolate--homocysteine methyltransferase
MKDKEDILGLIGKKILLLDGAMGSMLLDAGLKNGEVPELWNLEKHEHIGDIHRHYFRAGSDIVQTNTFGANRIKLSASGFEDLVGKTNRAAARLAREVCPAECYIAGDVGPTGKFLKPVGEYEFEEFKDVFAEQAQYLDEEGVDLFHVETMYDLNEAVAALEGIQSVSGKPIFISMTFQHSPRGFFTIMGNKPVPSLQTLIDKGAAVVGSNCTLSGEEMYELAREIRQDISFPLVFQPNAGQPVLEDDKITYPEDPGLFGKRMENIIALGVQVIGGCCGTTPDTIRVLRNLIDSSEKSN